MLENINEIIEKDLCATTFKVLAKMTPTINSLNCKQRDFDFADRKIACYNVDQDKKLDFADEITIVNI